MTDEIREHIRFLLTIADDVIGMEVGDRLQAKQAADTMEKLLAVLIAARKEHAETKGMVGIERWGIAELVSETNMRCLEARIEDMDKALDQMSVKEEK